MKCLQWMMYVSCLSVFNETTNMKMQDDVQFVSVTSSTQQPNRRGPAARPPPDQHSSSSVHRPDIEHFGNEDEDEDMEQFGELDVEGTVGGQLMAKPSTYGITGKSALFDEDSSPDEEEDFEVIRKSMNRQRLQKDEARRRFAVSGSNIPSGSSSRVKPLPQQQHAQSSSKSLISKTRTPPMTGLTMDQRSWLSPHGPRRTSTQSLGPGTEVIPSRVQPYRNIVENFGAIIPNAHSPSRNATVKFLRSVRVVPIFSPSNIHRFTFLYLLCLYSPIIVHFNFISSEFRLFFVIYAHMTLLLTFI
jgi:hypothetical protein